MNSAPSAHPPARVLSGMRPTGGLHLGNYHGALRNWVALQDRHEGYFFVADWHALTTDYENPGLLQQHVHDMVVDWLGAGLDPERSAIFVQSQVRGHAELHLLLSMITPLGWLERVPTYKDQQAQLKEKDLATYGFLGYPLLQSADILIYRPAWVPVGEDQVAHVEMTRELARRFNFLYGKDEQFGAKVRTALGRIPAAERERYGQLRRSYQQDGSQASLQEARSLVAGAATLEEAERALLLANLEGEHHQLLPLPDVLLTPSPKVPGLDGRKMSKSYGNTIRLGEEPESVARKIKGMTTDPARVRRTDPGNPDKCPVWDLHKLYSSDETLAWVRQGCTTAGIGCLDCKKPVIEKISAEAVEMRERAEPYRNNPGRVREILAAGAVRANTAAEATLDVVRHAMHLVPEA
ncbi:MAG TPA: tryptophan--tRNA ligase [Steroidobacteraceae bacterium]|nr:tryptophan--tRNA ligase [Steroidobacteraceae bacterium]